MPTRCLSSLLILVVALFAVSAVHAEQVTVMSYNVENMFDIFDDPYSNDEGGKVKPREEIEAIAKAIASVDADVVVFQELENEHILEGMVSTFLAEAGYEYIACQRTNSGRGINLGVISRYPIKRLASYRFTTLAHPDVPDQTWRFARDVMQVTVDVKGNDLHLFNVHLKSNRNRSGDPNSMKYRSAEVLGLKKIIRGVLKDKPGAYVLALGDFNSNLETRPEQDRPWPAMQLFRQAEADGSQLLIDAHGGIKDYNDRTTILGDDKYPPAIFDYIYASPALNKKMVKDSAGIVRDKAITSGSDHLPVYATYDIGD